MFMFGEKAELDNFLGVFLWLMFIMYVWFVKISGVAETFLFTDSWFLELGVLR